MNVSSASPTSSTTSAHPATPARAADGDYKVKSSATSQVKDSDGDYKPARSSSAPASSATSTSSNAVLDVLINQKKGGA